MYGNSDNSTVTFTTINRMTASFTKLVVIAIICYAKPNQKRRIVPGNRINNEGIDSKLKRVTRTALSLGPITPKCNYIMLRQN